MRQYNLWFTCKNKKCEGYDKELGPTHSDNLYLSQTVAGVPFKILDDKGNIVGKYGYYVPQSICPKCQVQMDETKEEDTEDIINPILHKDITYCTEDMKKSSSYYTRWNNSVGGKPNFNPVSGTGSPNGKKTLD